MLTQRVFLATEMITFTEFLFHYLIEGSAFWTLVLRVCIQLLSSNILELKQGTIDRFHV